MNRPQLHLRHQAMGTVIILIAAVLASSFSLPQTSEYAPASTVKVRSQAHLADIFSDQYGSRELSSESRRVLWQYFGAYYQHNPFFAQKMRRATEPRYSNFTFVAREAAPRNQFTVAFPPGRVAPMRIGTVEVQIQSKKIAPHLKKQAVRHLFPELAPQYAQLRQAAAAQRQTQDAVKNDRSNINCHQMKCIALTFDDGPDGKNGHQIIDALAARKAIGTFFVVGNKSHRHPDELLRAVRLHNELGNHSWDHAVLPGLSSEAISRQINQTNEVVRAVAGVTPRFFRPPYGSFDAHVAANAHLPLALWNVDPRDWEPQASQQIASHVITNAHRNAIVLLHSTSAATAQAIPEIIDELQAQGFILVTLSEMFGINDQNAAGFSGQVFWGG